MRKYLIFLILAVSMLITFTACGGDSALEPVVQEQEISTVNGNVQSNEAAEISSNVYENESGIFHQFDSLGFSIVFPEFWEGKFGLEEFYVEFDFGTRHFVDVYHIATREELGHSGGLFTLGRSPREHYSYDGERPVMAGSTIFLAQTGGNTYFVNFPSGVEYSENPDSETAAEYLEMVGHWEQSHWDFLLNSFRLL